ncbi:thiol-disulfide isomerase/thioredoxin [Microbacterium sp. SORGH_AS 1204]|uniref:TlpA family protein disulfide reductase n=1 Tax=Microbacterium sp. SORGH_AS_1204 TaxID=3041785 RepID=UPI002793BBC4|nr:thioredoxin family protein [Microbacterium sp. SORGH_AS_1204]MDQ1137371.1 thiol-disulfide isomerase/thioredoxin [Microbacterium sp. SORGH_AS_1204]
MDLPLALVIVAALLATTVAVGLLWRRGQGRVRTVDSGDTVDPQVIEAGPLGDSATLVQFSTELCARCPGVHRMLAALADSRPGVRHLDVDLTHRPDLAQRFRVLQTPTILLVDATGMTRRRFGGPPARADVERELDNLIKESAHG